MKRDYVLQVEPQRFWDYCSDFFDQDQLSDPYFHNVVSVHLLPNDKETWHLQVILNWRGLDRYTAKWNSFEKQILSMGWILRNLTEETLQVEAERKRLGLDGGVILDKTWRTNPDDLRPHINNIIRDESTKDESLEDVGIEILLVPGGIQYLIGYGTFSNFGFIQVIKLNDIISRVKIYHYQATFKDENGIKFFQKGKTLLSVIAGQLNNLYERKFEGEPGSILHNGEIQNIFSEKATSDKAEELEIWDRIPDISWDRVAVEMHCKGYTHKEIGKKVFADASTVTNKISKLRKIHNFIPTSFQVRKNLINNK